MTTVEHIKDWLERASKRGMEKEDIVFLMVQIRHLIEGKHDIADYRVTELYCNWMVHTSLYTSDGGLFIIKDLTKALVENWNKTNENAVAQVSSLLGLSNLRTELIKLFTEHTIPTIIVENKTNWENLVGFLTYYLRGKPIHYPSKESVKKQRLKDLVDEIDNIKKPADFYIKNVSIVGDKSPYWCIELGGEKDTTKIVGELLIEK